MVCSHADQQPGRHCQHPRRVGVDVCNPGASDQERSCCRNTDEQSKLEALLNQRAGPGFVTGAAPVADAGAGRNGQGQRNHIADGGQIGGDLVAGRRERALPCHIQGHEGEGGDFHQNG
ncbi:hypothetical protein SDC9_185612 [bioreactor metagenome]|uniref:Uncharacterized protein n=1 Tax=bioreactor metagenome TaxID=1076179 RepID=A0A645HGC3_9ZZZZ